MLCGRLWLVANRLWSFLAAEMVFLDVMVDVVALPNSDTLLWCR